MTHEDKPIANPLIVLREEFDDWAILFDPDSGDDVERCPWLIDRLDQKGHLCGIEDVKPDHCKAYPEHRGHAEATGCKAYPSDE